MIVACATHHFARQSVDGHQLPSQVDAASGDGVVIYLHLPPRVREHTTCIRLASLYTRDVISIRIQ
jgi:hypothetical protein